MMAAMDISNWPNGQIHQRWDHTLRVYTEYDPAGLLIEQRPFNDAENARADADAANRLQDANQSELRADIDASIAAINAMIGAGDYVATGIQDPLATMRSLTNMTNSALGTDFTANVGRWLKYLLRNEKRMGNELIRLLRLVGQEFDSASVGDES